jgi:hypothetical protein
MQFKNYLYTYVLVATTWKNSIIPEMFVACIINVIPNKCAHNDDVMKKNVIN